MKHLFSEKIDSTSSNALEARKGKVEGHAGSKSKFSALNRRCTMVEGMETGRFLTGFKTLLLCPPHWGVDILLLLFPASAVWRPDAWFPLI